MTKNRRKIRQVDESFRHFSKASKSQNTDQYETLIFQRLGMVLAVGMEQSIPQSSPPMNIDDFRKNPHDAFFRLLMSEPKNIKAYTEHILPKSVHAACRWADLEIVQTDFIDEALNEKRSDLLYRVPCGAGVIAIHILLEHQSSYDPSMPLRLLEYMTLIWRRELSHALRTAAHNMLQQGFDVPTIAKCLSLEEAEVLQIQAELS